MSKKKLKPPAREAERLKIDVGWEQAAEKLLGVPAGSVPPRDPSPRKKKGSGAKPKP